MREWIGAGIFFGLLIGGVTLGVIYRVQSKRNAPPPSPLQEYANTADARQAKRWAEEAKAEGLSKARMSQLLADEKQDIKEKDRLLAEMKYISNRHDLGEISEAAAMEQGQAIKSRLESLVVKMKRRQNEAHQIKTGTWKAP